MTERERIRRGMVTVCIGYAAFVLVLAMFWR
jgi:hypothetical protein